MKLNISKIIKRVTKKWTAKQWKEWLKLCKEIKKKEKQERR